ncbi:MAG: hypothetical protein M3Z23_13990 [Acidobacteriota bacterium]|nr:hypothetical protein [Acidobacteriota bacterium]
MPTAIFRITFVLSWVAFAALAQPAADIEKIANRLDKLEQDNRALLQEIRDLRQELAVAGNAGPSSEAVDERLQVQERRTAELAQTKVEASQRMPVSLTGMLLFNAFANGKSSGTSQDPVAARRDPSSSSSGASFRQTVLGLKFSGPDLPGGGKASGSLYMDFFAGTPEPDNHLLRIRVATVDLAWKNTTLTVGQDKPILAPREPSSLAQVGVSPLTGAGNLWDWQPQVRLEQRFPLGERNGLRAQAAVYQTSEADANVPVAFAKSLERWRPGYEGRFEFWHAAGVRRFEIAPGFHFSATHVAATSVPSRAASLDWMIKPVSLIEFSGAWFRGENLANLGTLRQGFVILSTGKAIPIHSLGGWAQIAIFPTGRLSVHFYGGQQRDRESDLKFGGIARNFVYAGNFIYRLAPNLLTSLEFSQTRTTYIDVGNRLNNHYDLALAYLF